ncbi:MAG: tRNA (adenosine(37)-N6)-threonylcarbamoyltransferase complex ATPase subunit type 1 TsaE [Lentisphaeria bacterium]|jgi:tRNA threonylcarbamoyladenosine biosynthesis protein TsaE|nr:tRNA (adenosine(37)-N6)-threonylcarbamoyltransferase complex ATPase subunit type 1 TsaE [Lentisphaeria bacterium]MDY0175400.1 tRNA (adenosine(37)-N6)-threonylcarbamoyltransferase complex ATPase subunit type 1 TsaE [Lentisphaeria bacterium]NLZ59749.1 tRNA (adenosine(37)-N6)-threonylcarbamoyltransferase complex ATPase subunit type 1 TsaE [Lentisphaerota bacterium]
MQFLSSDSEASLALGRKLAALLEPGMVVALHGELGAGKTLFCRGIAQGLGYTGAVTSPTFTVAQEYPLQKGRYLYHLDLYRIQDEEAALAFGIDEFLFADYALCLIEWPERITALLQNQQALLTINLYHHSEEERRIELPDQLGERLIGLGLPANIEIVKD